VPCGAMAYIANEIYLGIEEDMFDISDTK